MRIHAIEPLIVEIPLIRPFVTAHGACAVQRSALVRLASDEGIEGWGDVDPTPGYTAMTPEEIDETVRRVAPRLLGSDPFNIHLALHTMDREVAGCFEAKAAIEMALWDLKAKALGVPVHSLLGGRVKSEVTLNAWIGAVPPAEAAREAREWLARGFTSAKVKVTGTGPAEIDRVAAVRDAVGDRMALRVDANESLDVREAIELIKRLKPYRIALFEQPVPRHDLDGMAKIRRAVDTPIMADESVQGPDTLVEIIKREAADIVKVKVMKQGGLLRTSRLVEMAAAAGIRSVIGHGFGLALSTLAEVHVAATTDQILPGCEAVGPLKMTADVVSEPLQLAGGLVKVPEEPGLGAAVDDRALAQYRVGV